MALIILDNDVKTSYRACTVAEMLDSKVVIVDIFTHLFFDTCSGAVVCSVLGL